MKAEKEITHNIADVAARFTTALMRPTGDALISISRDKAFNTSEIITGLALAHAKLLANAIASTRMSFELIGEGQMVNAVDQLQELVPKLANSLMKKMVGDAVDQLRSSQDEILKAASEEERKTGH